MDRFSPRNEQLQAGFNLYSPQLQDSCFEQGNPSLPEQGKDLFSTQAMTPALVQKSPPASPTPMDPFQVYDQFQIHPNTPKSAFLSYPSSRHTFPRPLHDFNPRHTKPKAEPNDLIPLTAATSDPLFDDTHKFEEANYNPEYEEMETGDSIVPPGIENGILGRVKESRSSPQSGGNLGNGKEETGGEAGAEDCGVPDFAIWEDNDGGGELEVGEEEQEEELGELEEDPIEDWEQDARA